MSTLKPAMQAELIALRARKPNGEHFYLSQDLALYAFYQHVLRNLRAHTSSWSETLRSTAPSEMKGRAGSEHLRPKVTEIMSSQAAWPFHLAGDSGATLFETPQVAIVEVSRSAGTSRQECSAAAFA